MKILITGGTGFIGSSLSKEMCRNGHRVFVYTRNRRKAERHPFLQSCTILTDKDEFPQVDVIVNLAGASISSWPLTPRHLRHLIDSRLHVLGILKNKYAQKTFPSLLIQASATSVYRQGRPVNEKGELGDTPEGLVSLTVERAAADLCAGRAALAIARIGMVIGPQGGIVKALRYFPAFSIWNNRSIMPWITLEDCVRALTFIAEEKICGIYNLSSPKPMRLNEVLKRARPALLSLRLPLPSGLVKLDSRSRLIFFDAYIRPDALLNEGFKFNN